MSDFLTPLGRHQHNHRHIEHVPGARYAPRGLVELGPTWVDGTDLRPNPANSQVEDCRCLTNNPQVRRAFSQISTQVFPCAATNIWPLCIVEALHWCGGRSFWPRVWA